VKRSPLKRGKPLRPDPGKVREFLQRGRESSQLKRTELKSKRRARPPEGPLDPATWRKRVMALDGYRCRVSLSRARDADDRGFHVHHVIPGLHDRVYDERNGIVVRADVHMNHEAASRRIPGERLPYRTREFAAELGLWAVDLLDRLHPPTDGGPR